VSRARSILNEVTDVPSSFPRDRTTKVKAGDGWIYVRPAGSGFYVTATGMKGEQVPAKDIRWFVRELYAFMTQ